MILVLAFSVHAVEVNINQYLEDLDNTKTNLNSNLEVFSNGAKALIGDFDANLKLEKINGETENIKIVFKDQQIKTLEKGKLENPDLTLELKEITINEIVNSEDPKKEIKNKLKNSEIKYTAHNFWLKIKLKIALKFL
jgi:hypothetical protein